MLVAGTHGCIFPWGKDLLGKLDHESGPGHVMEQWGQPKQGSLHPQAESNGWARSSYPVKWEFYYFPQWELNYILQQAQGSIAAFEKCSWNKYCMCPRWGFPLTIFSNFLHAGGILVFVAFPPYAFAMRVFWAQRPSLWIEMKLLVFPLFQGGKQSNWGMHCFSPDLFLCSAHFFPPPQTWGVVPNPEAIFCFHFSGMPLAAGLEGSRPSWEAAAQGSLLLLPVNCKKNVIYQGRCSTRI